jgi:aminobenzoyl-glutamate utilization protein B
VDHEVINAVYSMLPNESLSRVMDRNLRKVGGVSYTTEERAFANRIRSTLGDNPPALEEASRIEPLGNREASGSTDVADVSWTVPTGGLYTATWVPGTPGHSWQAAAASASSIGAKGMIVAAKTLALTAVDLFTDRQALADARAEYRKRVGPDFTYRALVGDRKPPLDYRDKP